MPKGKKFVPRIRAIRLISLSDKNPPSEIDKYPIAAIRCTKPEPLGAAVLRAT